MMAWTADNVKGKTVIEALEDVAETTAVIEERVTDCENDIIDIEDRLTETETAITGLESTTESLTDAVNTAEEEIDSLDTRVETVESRIPTYGSIERIRTVADFDTFLDEIGNGGQFVLTSATFSDGSTDILISDAECILYDYDHTDPIYSGEVMVRCGVFNYGGTDFIPNKILWTDNNGTVTLNVYYWNTINQNTSAQVIVSSLDVYLLR